MGIIMVRSIMGFGGFNFYATAARAFDMAVTLFRRFMVFADIPRQQGFDGTNI